MSVDSLIRPIALIGSPNSGKTTLFNWITGSKVRAVNYAGSTVDCFRGNSLPVYGLSTPVVDTPGVYSLQPHGQDEEVTLRALNAPGVDAIHSVIVVVDGTQLNRQLYLVRQVQELGIPFVVAVTMVDIVKNSGRQLDLDKLSDLVDAPVLPVDGRLGGGVAELLEQARSLTHGRLSSGPRNLIWDNSKIEKEIAVSESWARLVMTKTPEQRSLDHLRRWDRVLLHPFWGVVFFVLIMTGLFSSIFWLAAPLMDLVDSAFSFLANHTTAVLGETALSHFIADGIISGVGAVMVFVPQIFILFVGFTLLEDTGYLARAATIVDRPMHKIGLSGRAFVPILSGFACAVPGIMATRNVRSPRERWITVFIIPFMTCSARLPVYALLLTFLFRGDEAWKAGLALTGLYMGGLFLGALAAAVLNRILKAERESHFLMELPIYRWPKAGFTLRLAFRRTRSYVKKAGPTIFFFVLVLWAGTHFPYHSEATPTQQLEQSALGQLGQVLGPVFHPMKVDWRVGLGMMSAFVAREVFVSSMAVIFNIASTDNDASMQESLLEKMRSAQWPDGSPIFTVASVCGLIVFFMIALQCLSTTGVTWREMGSWKYAVVQLVSLNVLAYVAAVVVAQALG
jgi:ferrous iron transport protein B